MPTQIQIKRGTATTPTGLTTGELAHNTNNNQIWIGNTGGAVWVGSEVTAGVDMGAGSAVSATRVPTQSGVYNYVRNNFVTSFNGATGAVIGVQRLNGLTGGVTLAAGTNVGITSSGNTITISVTGLSASASDFVAQGKLSGNVGITSGADYVIPFVDDYDPQNWYDPTTKQFKPNIAGYYEISLSAWWAQAGITNGQSNIQARRNGTDTFLIAQAQLQTGSGYNIGGTKTIFLNGSTDYVDFSAYTSNTTSQTLQIGTASGSGTWFTAFLIANNTPPTAYVSSFNGLTGAVGGVCAAQANTFTAVQTFTGGISASTGITLASPNLTGTPIAPTAAVGTSTTQIATTAFVNAEIIADAVTGFNGRTGSVQGVSAAVAGDGISVSGATGSVTFTNTGVTRAAAGTGISVSANTGAVTITNIGVVSFNGLTGSVGGVCAAQANTFTAVQTFTGGISASVGVTFGNDIRVYKQIRVGAGGTGSYAGTSNNEALGDDNFTNTAIGYLSLHNNTPGADIDGGYGIYNTAVGFRALFANRSAVGLGALWNTAVGAFALRTNTTGPYNTAVGYYALAANTTGNDNVAVGVFSQNTSTTATQCTSVGSNSLSTNTASDNTAIGCAAMNVKGKGARNVSIGSYSGFYWGPSQINYITAATGGIYIGYQARGGADAQTNEIVIGTDALGLGSNTAVIGATTQTAATIYGLLSTPGGISSPGATFTGQARFVNGISAAGGITLTGIISIGGQTFTNVTSTVNGLSGGVGTGMIHMGYTSGSVLVFTYPDGVTTTANKTPLYQPYQTYQILNYNNTVTANRTYFTPHVAVRPINLKTLQFLAANTVTTGNCYFSVWSADPLTGFPRTRLYVSSSIAVASGYGTTSVTNASGLVSVPAGPFYIAVSFSSTPTVYCMSMSYVPPLFGSGNMTSGYNMAIPAQDTNGYTAPSSITQSGTTFGFIDYSATGNYRQGVFTEFGVV